MKKNRLTSLLLAIMMVVQLVGIVPVSAADTYTMQNGDVEAIKAGMDALQKAMYAVSEKMYQAANPQGQQPPYGAPGAGPDMGGNPAGDVYDADYKDVE